MNLSVHLKYKVWFPAANIMIDIDSSLPITSKLLI